MVAEKIFATALVMLALVLMWRVMAVKGRRLLLRAKTLGLVLSGTLALFGAWIILNIWGVIPLLTNTAVIGVWFFFFMWFLKDLILDNFFAGIKLIMLRKIKPGDRIRLVGKKYTVEEIKATETVLKTESGTMMVPNMRLAQEAIICKPGESSKKKAHLRGSASRNR